MIPNLQFSDLINIMLLTFGLAAVTYGGLLSLRCRWWRRIAAELHTHQPQTLEEFTVLEQAQIAILIDCPWYIRYLDSDAVAELIELWSRMLASYQEYNEKEN